jgi:hypothetical protein
MSRWTEEELRNHITPELRARLEEGERRERAWRAEGERLGWDETELAAVAHLASGACEEVVGVTAEYVELEKRGGGRWRYARGTFERSLARLRAGQPQLPPEPPSLEARRADPPPPPPKPAPPAKVGRKGEAAPAPKAARSLFGS